MTHIKKLNTLHSSRLAPLPASAFAAGAVLGRKEAFPVSPSNLHAKPQGQEAPRMGRGLEVGDRRTRLQEG